ncbi:hypothetical protein ACA910_008896 [Epithemia clementina (nom. ined.)]
MQSKRIFNAFSYLVLLAISVLGVPAHIPENNVNKENTSGSQAASPPAGSPRRFLTPSYNERVRTTESKTLSRRRIAKKGSSDRGDDDDDDDSYHSNSALASSDRNDGDGALQGSSFIYEQDQLGNTVSEVSKSEGEDYSSKIGKFSPDLFCTSTMCAGIGRAELIGESPENDDEDYLEVIISGPTQGDAFGPDGTVLTAGAASSFKFFCPSGLQEVKNVEVVGCECFAGDSGSCDEESFSLLGVDNAQFLNPITLIFTANTSPGACTTGFRAQVIIECRD